MPEFVFVPPLFALTMLSIVSMVVLRGASPFTSTGWLFTALYCAATDVEIYAHRPLPAHVGYWFLAAMAVAFAIAGVRDEAQAEPWWLPKRLGQTRAARKAPPR